MELGVKDRLILLGVLPKEGNITTLKIVRKLREELSFNEEEHKLLNFREKAGMTVWNFETDGKKEIEIGEKATDVIVETLKGLDRNNKLHEDHLPLWEIFMEGGK